MMLAGHALASSGLALADQLNVLAVDLSGNGFHGHYAPAGFLERDGATADNDGGVHLDGTIEQFIIVPDAANLRITTMSGVLSWEFWIKSASFAAEGATTQRVWCKNEDVNNQWAINLSQNGANGRLGIGVDYSSVTYSVTADAGAGDIPPNQWTHCVITMNATTPLLYVNGILVAATTTAQGIGSGANMLFGRLAQNSSTGRFIGALDEAAIYPDVLTPLEILRHYAAAGGQNTNHALRSQEFDNASWSKIRASVSANTTTAPNGSATADTLIEDASASTTHYAFLSNVALANNTVYTFSVYAKTKERSQLRLYVSEGATGTDFFNAIFDVTNGLVLSSAAGGTGQIHGTSITSVGNGWYRCAVTGIYGTTGTTLDAFIQLASGGTATYTGNGTSGLYLWGAQLEANASVGRYIPTTTAAVTLGTYAEEVLVDVPRGYWRLGEGAPQQLDSWPQKPINVEVDGDSWRESITVNNLSIEDTLGEQMSCSFVAVNPTNTPQVGNIVRVRYYDQVLFAGTIDRLNASLNNTGTARWFKCTCVDWSQSLVRIIINRNFIDYSLIGCVSSLLQYELAGEGLTLGTADKSPSIPLVDSTGSTAFDLLRDIAGATGQTFYVDFDKAIQFRATSNEMAPLTFNASTVETAELYIDRETYRNIQTVRVTGTPAEGSGDDAVKVTVESSDAVQIAERAALEGGSGRYMKFEDVTHPISNLPADLEVLALGYAELRLATSGSPRETLRCRVRPYGFRAGQFALVDLLNLGIASSTWLIQRVSIQEEDGRRLIHDIELVLSSQQQRAYESWIAMIGKGKIAVQIFDVAPHSSQLFDTLGAHNWVVPAGVTKITVTANGPGGGGGGGTTWIVKTKCVPTTNCYGGAGGNGGKAVSALDVVEGETISITIGAVGQNGIGGYIQYGTGASCGTFTAPTAGTAGASTTVYRDAISIAEAYAGGGGGISSALYIDGPNGAAGGGSGSIVTVGGGAAGGVRGDRLSGDGGDGALGSVLIEW